MHNNNVKCIITTFPEYNKVICAMEFPSWGIPGIFYPALVIDKARGNITVECQQMSKELFPDKQGILHIDALP